MDIFVTNIAGFKELNFLELSIFTKKSLLIFAPFLGSLKNHAVFKKFTS